MGKPIFVLAGQSNARRISSEVKNALDAEYGEDGYILVKTMVSGAPLTREGKNKRDWATDDELPLELIGKLKEAVRDNPDAYSGGMIWVQGEADTWAAGRPDDYQAGLIALIDRITTEVSAEPTQAAASFAQMKLVISQLATMAPAAGERDHWSAIIDAQENTARFSDDIAAVDPDELALAWGMDQATMFDDPLHYSNQFSQILANRLVDVAASMSEAARDQFRLENTQHDQGVERFLGNELANMIFGTDRDDIIKGKGGDDVLLGGGGNDKIVGGAHQDEISGGVGSDKLFGLDGQDFLRGGDQRDWLYGGQGDDIVHGDAGADELRGNRGNDALFGGADTDDLRGGVGNDALNGGAQKDYLFGGQGEDHLEGGAGNDALTGGHGGGRMDGEQDTFVYSSSQHGGGGFDRIKDFEDGIDRIDLTAFEFAHFETDVQVLASSAGGGADTRISFGNGDVLYIENLVVSDFTWDDVIL